MEMNEIGVQLKAPLLFVEFANYSSIFYAIQMTSAISQEWQMKINETRFNMFWMFTVHYTTNHILPCVLFSEEQVCGCRAEITSTISASAQYNIDICFLYVPPSQINVSTVRHTNTKTICVRSLSANWFVVMIYSAHNNKNTISIRWTSILNWSN